MKTKKPTYKQLEKKLTEAEQVIEALRSGERDAVLSEERVMVLRLRETEQALHANEQRLRLAMEGGKLGVWDRDTRTGRIEWNLRLYEILGRSPDGEPVNGETFFEYIHEADRPRVRKNLEKALRSGDTFQDEFRIVREDGEERWLVSSGRLYRDETGEVVRMSGINYDITERKRAEVALNRERELLRSVVDSIPVMLVMYDPKFERFTLNKHARDVLGWTNKEANRGDFMSKVYPDPVYRKKVGRFMDSLLHEWREFDVTTKKGDTVPSEWTNISLNNKTRIGIGIDISQQKAAERALHESEERFRTLAENSPDVIARFDRELRHVYVNQSITDLTGLPPAKFIGKTLRQMRLPEPMCRRCGQAISTVFTTGKPGAVEYTFDQDGRTAVFHCTLTPEFDLEGDVKSVLSVSRDITPIRDTEERLRKERDLLEIVMDNTNTHLAYLDADFHFLMVNEAYVKGCGKSREDLIGRNHFVLFPDEENRAIFERVRDTGEPFSVEAKPFEYPDDPDRGVTYWDWSLIPVKGGGGEVTGLVFSLIDVTEDQRAIEERERFIDEIQSLSNGLKNQTAELEAVIGSLADPVLVFNAQARIIRTNRAARAVFGRDLTDVDDKVFLSNLLLPPGCEAPCPENRIVHRRAISGEVIKDEVCVLRDAEGEIRYGLVSASPIKDPFDLNGAVVTWHDITERRRRQERLQTSEQRYALAQQLAGIGNWDWDIRSGRLDWSDTIATLFGLEKGAFDQTYRSFLRLVHPEDRKTVLNAINACIEEGEPYDVEHRVIRSDGEVRWMRETGDVIRDEHNLAVRMMGMVQDVTARKKALESQRLLAEIVAESQDAIIVRDTEGVITSWNAGAERIYGYTAEEMIGEVIDRILPEDRKHEQKRLLARTRRGEHIRHYETVKIRKDGAPIHVAVSFSPIRNESGEVYAIASIEHDITKRILDEIKLREAKEELEDRVIERTRELHQTNRELRKENRRRQDYQKRLRSLTEELIRAEERQRREIAAGLHDRVIQMLIFSNIKLNQVIQNLPDGTGADPIETVQQNLDETIHELRTMTFQISPPVLYELGLVPALEWLTEQFRNKYGFACEFEDDGEEKPLTDDVRNMLFQAVNELMTNIAKHAKADHVWIRSEREDGSMRIEVKDDGCGFDPETLHPDTESIAGFGLFNIQERIEFLQGDFLIESKPEQGTCIQLKAPLNLGNK